MTGKNVSQKGSKDKGRLKATHYGTVKLGPELTFECAVLEDGRRGFIQRQMVKTLGFTEKTRSGRFERFCAKIGLNPSENTGEIGVAVFEVDMPSGGTANWVDHEILRSIIKAGILAHGQGKLTKHQEHIGQRCVHLGSALIGVGLVALIDEATGYQYAREPNALQDLISTLIREEARDWDRRFHPTYYQAMCKIFGFPYGNRHRPLPSIIGQMTLNWVYKAVMPNEIVEEIRSRKKSAKFHQWLTDDAGLRLLEKQIDAVTTIAKSSVDYKDFEARCTQAFCKPGQQLSMIYPRGGPQ